VHGDFSVPPVRATDNPAEAGIVDLAVVCVKTPATEEAARVMRPMIGPETTVLSLQSGVDLDPDVIAQTLGLLDGAAAAMKPSMQRDVEAGRPSELESMIGLITRQGRERGVPTPVADLVYAALLPAELKARRAAV